MKDANPRMRVQAIRASETLYKAGDQSFAADYRAMTKDPDTDVAIQAMLTLNLFKVPDSATSSKATQAASKARGVKEIGDLLLKPPAAVAGSAARDHSRGTGRSSRTADGIYKALCFSCHGERRPRHAARRRGARRDDGAAARRIAARATGIATTSSRCCSTA